MLTNLWKLTAKRLNGSKPSVLRSRRVAFESLECRELMSATNLLPSTTDLARLSSAAATVTAPAAPSLTATAVSGSQINLSWNLVAKANGYVVDEWISGAWKQIGSFGSTTSGCAVTGLNTGTAYYFDVAAYNSAGYAWAPYQGATTYSPPAAPSLKATAASSSQINLSWNSVSGANGYLVDEWINGAWKQIASYGNNVTGCAVGALSANTTYSFEVAAYNAGGTTWSAIQNATTYAVVDHPIAAAGTTYAVVNGSLFGANGPSYLDVHQGQIGDCWLLASLAEVADRDPADIRNMFTSAGTTVENGVTVSLYTVRFFNSAGVAKYVTVDNEFPVMGGTTYYDHVQNNVLWVALAEKAYAQANGASIVTTGKAGSDSYAALDFGWPYWALQAITGKPASSYSINPTNIAAAWQAGQLIVLGSSTAAGDNLVVGDSTHGTHAYAVVNYTGTGSTPFELYNPWGYSSTVGALTTYYGHQVYSGLFYASASMIAADFSSQSIGTGVVGQASNNSFGSADAGTSNANTSAGNTDTTDRHTASGFARTEIANLPGATAQSPSNGVVDELFATWGADAHATRISVRHLSATSPLDLSLGLSDALADELALAILRS